jgi:Mg-chelatase subunit ChlD
MMRCGRFSGGTAITEGLRLALQQIMSRKHKNDVSSILLLSDGLDSNAENGARQLFSTISPNDNFTVHTFGYGSDHDPKMMSAICKMRGGKFYYIEKLERVAECFICLSALITVVAQNLRLTVTVGWKSEYNECSEPHG